MLSKLGWSQGQTLGKNQTGLLEPVRILLKTANDLCLNENSILRFHYNQTKVQKDWVVRRKFMLPTRKLKRKINC